MNRVEARNTMNETDASQVYGWAYRLLQNHHDALDATQEVLLRWVAAGQAAINRRAWLRRVTFNHCIDILRFRKREPLELGDEASKQDSGIYPAQRELHLAIADGLHRLTEQQRTVIIAKVYDQQTFAEIAAQMGLSASTVKTHYVRALDALREPLKSFVEMD